MMCFFLPPEKTGNAESEKYMNFAFTDMISDKLKPIECFLCAK